MKKAALAMMLTLPLAMQGVSAQAAIATEPFVGTVPEEGFSSDEGQVTLVVNGKETEIVPGTTYTEDDNAEIVVTNAAGSYAGSTLRPEENYRTALFVDETGVNADKSVEDAVAEGSYDNEKAEGIKIDSSSDSFSGVIVKDASYDIKDADLTFDTSSDGSDVSDFTGYGTVLSVFGKDAKLTAENVNIHTTGVAKAALVTGEGADTLISDSTITTEGGTLYDGYKNTSDQSIMVAPPWVLGISGTARSTLLIGEGSTNTFVRTKVNSSGWGALSTDSCTDVKLTAIDSEVNLTEDVKEQGGYGTFAIGNAELGLYGTTMNASTMAAVMSGGTLTLAPSEGTFDIVNKDGETVFEGIEGQGNKTTINTQAFGLMFMSMTGSGGGDVNIAAGTEINTKNATFLVKSTGANINADGASINAEDGVIMQIMDSDDAAVGVSGNAFNTSYSEKEGYPGIDYEVEEVSGDAGMAGATAGDLPEDMSEGFAPSGGDQSAPEGFEGSDGRESAPEGFEGSDGSKTELPQGEMPEGMSEGFEASAGGQSMPDGFGASDGSQESNGVTATFTNMELKGDFYNASGYTASAQALTVNLGSGAVLSGAVTAASAIHSTDGGETQNAEFTIDEFWKMGHMADKPFYNGSNNVTVSVTDGAVWTVTGESVLTSLTVGEGCTLNGDVYVEGEQIEPEAGKTYEGNITVQPQE